MNEVATRCGWAPANLSRVLNGPNVPKLDRVDALAQAFGVQPWELLRDPDEPASEMEFDRAMEIVKKGVEALKKKSGN